MKKTIIETTREKMSEILRKREADLSYAADQIAAAERKKADALQEKDAAAARMDMAAFAAAKAEVSAAETSLELFSTRLSQIRSMDLVTEAESDAVIDSILAYEDGIAGDYKSELSPLLDTLRRVTSEYRDKVNAAEDTLLDWTGKVHPNYRNPHTTYQDGSHRAPTPVPVRPQHYSGCPESTRVLNFLKSFDL